MDVKDLLVRWKEVVKVCGIEHAAAPPSKKEAWKKARATAEEVVKVLQPAAQLEKAACEAWAAAREGSPLKGKKQPHLKLVKLP